MKIINKTKHPDHEVEALVHFGSHGLEGLKGSTVTVVPATRHCSGRGGRDRAIIRLAPERFFPRPGYKRFVRSPDCPFNHDWQNWQEALVALAAHECMHIQQFHTGYFRKHTAHRSEMACEKFEHDRLAEYRAMVALDVSVRMGVN
jgi:hypothetical protein